MTWIPRKFIVVSLLLVFAVPAAVAAQTPEPNCTKRQYGSNWVAICDEGASTAPLYTTPPNEHTASPQPASQPRAPSRADQESSSASSSSPGAASDGRVHVRGYTRRDGTYVAPHTRSAPRR
jgi:hypothetical protein